MAELLDRLIASRSDRRQSRNRRVSEVIDSLASQDAMDAAQGADVSSEGGSSPQMAEGSAGMLSSMPMMGSGGGGGGGQITTAAGSNATGQPMTQTGGCANGRCGTSIGTRFSPRYSMQPATTTTVSPQAAPAATTVIPQDGTLMQQGAALLRSVPSQTSPAASGRNLMTGQQLFAAGALEEQLELNRQQAEAAKQGAEFARRVYDESEPTRLEGTAVGRTELLNRTLDNVASLQTSPASYIEQGTAYWLRNIADAEQKADPNSVETIRGQYRMEAYGALAAGLITQAEAIDNLVERGIPVDPRERARVIERGIDSLMTSYTKEGLFDAGKPMSEIKSQLYNDLFPVLNRLMVEKTLEAEQDFIQSKPPEEQALATKTAEQDGMLAAGYLYDLVETNFETRLNQSRLDVFDAAKGYIQSMFSNDKDRMNFAPYDPPATEDSNDTLPPTLNDFPRPNGY